ncbi:MAG: lytic transglycosylase domain-containing protein [Syntrophales bacterium]|nr:lytic transglycosylase domain-containing protein [Syntrophales bacterium]
MAPRNYRCVRRAAILAAVLVICAAAVPLHADVYRYLDEEGTICFTNLIPPTANYKVIIRERKRFSGSSLTGKYDEHIQEASRKHGVAFPLIKAIMKAESDFDPRAVSEKGAKGLMQIMPFNFKALGIQDPFDPRENIMGGALYMRQLLDRFNGKVLLALAAYNAGAESVDRCNGIPPIPETENYVYKVMEFYELFSKR